MLATGDGRSTNSRILGSVSARFVVAFFNIYTDKAGCLCALYNFDTNWCLFSC